MSQCAADSTTSTVAAVTAEMGRGAAPNGDLIVRPVAVKLPLRVISDRMNADAGVIGEPATSRRPGKPPGAGAGAPCDVSRPVGENVTAWCDGEAPSSNSDDEVCDVFSRAARRLSVFDGRCCVRLLRALAAGGVAARSSTRWTGAAGLMPRRWLYDHRTSAVMNAAAAAAAAVELPRPFLDFAKMQVTNPTSRQIFLLLSLSHRAHNKWPE